MTTKIRDFGDGQTVVIHTNDRTLASQLSNYKSCFKEVPYEQQQKDRIVLVGIDYYFPKKQLKPLLRKLGIPIQPLKKVGSFTMEDFHQSQNGAG
jgi:hypothetical protein